MAYTDLTTSFILDKFFTYVDADNLAENDAHIKDSFAVEHNWNASTIDGTHKSNSILGSYINKTPVSSGSQNIAGNSSWTPVAGVYQLVDPLTNTMNLQIYVSGSWRGLGPGSDNSNVESPSGIIFCDGSNMRIAVVSSNGLATRTVWYQKF